jgi:hypothetical protein
MQHLHASMHKQVYVFTLFSALLLLSISAPHLHVRHERPIAKALQVGQKRANPPLNNHLIQ